jgi:uncharacterized protein
MGSSIILKHPEKIDDLTSFMASKERIEAGLAKISYDNGLITAVVVGPEMIMPSEWIPLIITPEDAEADKETAKLMTGMLMLEYDKIQKSICSDEKDYKPFLWKDKNGKYMARDWAEGFVTGMNLRRNAWKQLFDATSDSKKALIPIMLCLSDDIVQSVSEKNGDDQEELIEMAIEALPQSVQEINDYWRKRRKTASPTQQGSRKKVGRNEPCPCGSGRKYKKCCL